MNKNYIHSFIIGFISSILYIYSDKDTESYETEELFMNIKPKYVKLFVITTMTSLFVLTTFSPPINESNHTLLQHKVNTYSARQCPF